MIYLTVAEVLAIHQTLIDAFGGAEGVRDLGALEAALFRPQSGYYGDVIEEAAALMESLAINHPFVDGNKRVAFFVTDTFLRANGLMIDVEPDETHTMWIKLFETSQFHKAHLEAWLREVVKPL